MKKEYRLKKQQEFHQVISKGNKIVLDSFIIYYKKYDELKNAKIGISISKKVEKLAVRRNKIKRQIKSFLNEYNYNNKNKIVIIVRNKYTLIINDKLQEAKKQLINNLNKIK